MLKETTTKGMINNKEDLKAFLNEDLKRFRSKPVGLRDFILGNERWYTYHYVKQLRLVEYWMNSKSGGVKYVSFGITSCSNVWGM